MRRRQCGSVREADGAFSVPLAYAMYYIWGTRMLTGAFSYEFALYPFTGPWKAADLHRRALEYNFPLVATATKAGSGSLGAQVRFIEAASPEVIVSALYSEAGRIFTRLYEHRGEPASAGLRYLKGAARFTEVSLAGQDLGPTGPRLSFRPWQIRTVRVDTP